VRGFFFMPNPRYRTILFDLDGTLVDTAPDLAYALNVLRGRRGLPALADSLTRPQASHGTQGLLRVGFGLDSVQAEFTSLREEFLEVYAANLTARSPLFPGVAEMLAGLEERGLQWGVVTNKPARYTEPLLDHFGLRARAVCVVSGDTCAQSKPHPAPMLHACRLAASDPADCLYVGDAERDVTAAAAVGMPALVALYGYLGEDDRPEAWGAHGFIEAPLALLDWLPPGA